MKQLQWVTLLAGIVIGKAALAQQPDAYLQKAEALLQQLTLEEKVHMIHGVASFNSGSVPRLHIPELVTSDGPHGVRLEHGRGWTPLKNVADSGTYLPVGVCLAATWNPKLGYEFGSVLGKEAAFRGKDVILGPGINIMRTPLNGRNFEYQSEDPYLVSKMVVGYIKGVQDQGISACVKHYLANNHEVNRGYINVLMSERALREIYLPGFKAAVQEAGVNTIMGAYNKFRGQYCTENNYLVDQVLRKEWGFKGVVMSDWGAVHHTMEAVWNGTDLEMGSDIGTPPLAFNRFYLADTVVQLVKSGRVPEYYIDAKVRRILYIMAKTGMLDGSRTKGVYNAKEHQQTAARVAEEGIVLLKNNKELLPLDRNKIRTIAVIGENAVRLQSMGGGSSQVKAYYEITPLQGIQQAAGTRTKIVYAAGYRVVKNYAADAALWKEALEAARKADAVVFVGGTIHGYDYSKWDENAYDAEGQDKPDMKLPFGQDSLIKALQQVNPRTVVVLLGGGAVDMTAWADEVNGILEAWYPGMEGGNALAGILFGDKSPSGKLPVTFPRRLEEVPAHKLGEYPGDTVNVTYYDDIYVGYRYYDTYKVKPQFAFGHGLSYTSFAYSNMQVTGVAGNATVSFTVTNTGKRAGAEVAQVYVHQQKSRLPRPEKELKGFEKIWLQPGESRQVVLRLDKTAFSYYDDIQQQWVMEPGNYTIYAGGASDNLPLQKILQ